MSSNSACCAPNWSHERLRRSSGNRLFGAASSSRTNLEPSCVARSRCRSSQSGRGDEGGAVGLTGQVDPTAQHNEPSKFRAFSRRTACATMTLIAGSTFVSLSLSIAVRMLQGQSGWGWRDDVAVAGVEIMSAWPVGGVQPLSRGGENMKYA